MNEQRKINLSTKMLVCTHTAKNLLERIHALEADKETPMKEKLIQIKNIREEISKVGTEIDNIK